MDITEDVVRSVVRNVSSKRRDRWYIFGSFTGVATKFQGPHLKNRISVEYFVDLLVNHNPPWVVYRECMSSRQTVLDKIPGLNPVGVGETWLRLFDKCILKVTGSEATHSYKDDHLCAGLKVVIDGAVPRVQYIWGANSTEKNWGFLLHEKNIVFNDINRFEMLWMVCHL